VSSFSAAGEVAGLLATGIGAKSGHEKQPFSNCNETTKG
jgi:hypothetical protein